MPANTYARDGARRRAARDGAGESSRGASRSNGRRARQHSEEEEEEEEEGDDGDAGVIELDDDSGGERGGSADGNDDESDAGQEEHFRMARRKKLPVGKAAQTAGEKLGRQELNRKAQDLVRLALFSEHRRGALRRDEITEKVIGKASTRAFPVIFNKAAKILRATFGMELVELRARGTESQAHLNQATQALEKEAAGSGARKKRAREESADAEPSEKGVLSHSYVLRSLIPQRLIAGMGTPDAALQAPAAGPSQGRAADARDGEGVMIDWRRADGQQAAMGLLMILLSLILLNQRVLPDEQMRASLRRLALDPTEPLPRALCNDLPSGGAAGVGDARPTVDAFLGTLVKQGYLERVRSASAAGGGGGRAAEGAASGKRAMARRRTDGDEAEAFEWRWGARSEIEIGERNVAHFVGEVFLGAPPGDGGARNADGRERRARASGAGAGARGPRASGAGAAPATQGSAAREKALLKEIERAAGSQLVD